MKLKTESSPKSIRKSFLIDEGLSKDIELYAKSITSSTNWVVNQILSKFIYRDKEFAEWKKQNPDVVIDSSKPKRKPKAEKSQSPAAQVKS